jgi:hypothetical protein
VTQNTTTTVEIRDNAYGTRESPSFGGTPGFGWGWPDEAQLTDFAEMAHRLEQTEQPIENNFEYAALYFVS